ncbi:MAG TPA: hypothetical protein VI011_18660, partial [Asanoa sp.]
MASHTALGAQVRAGRGGRHARRVGERRAGRAVRWTGGRGDLRHIGETIAFHGFVVARELRVERASGAGRSAGRVLADLVVEFGPAEMLDSLAVRPLAMYVGPVVLGNLAVGVLAGKVAADLVFYAMAAVAHELNGRRRRPVPDPLTPATLDARRHRTPYLIMDLDRVVRAYRSLAAALPVDAVHYAVKCNPDLRVLTALHRAGCGFEVASYPELALLRTIGVDPADVLFSNPVKPAEHVARAHRVGCLRYAVDSQAELRKLAEHAPGTAVYVRLRALVPAGSTVPSEGKFGVGPGYAYDLLLAATELGLRPYGATFHVGSQMTRPEAWAAAIDEVGALLTRLAVAGIRLEMLDIGGGFPARYADPVPELSAYGRVIGAALDRLPYRPVVAAEPGRALVAEAGVLVAGVIGT